MGKGFLKLFLVLLFVLAVCLSASISHAAIPNMKGTWTGMASFVKFENVLKDGYNPVYKSGTVTVKITSQNGRLFAGRFIAESGYEEKLTGVIEADNTVTIQTFEHDGRGFFRGKMSIISGVMTLKGAFNNYEEITLSSDSTIETGQVTLKKVK